MRGFIFNLGHGVWPETPPDAVQTVVETVHAFQTPSDRRAGA
jgi:uroporphyrinogen-III decarboxylase